MVAVEFFWRIQSRTACDIQEITTTDKLEDSVPVVFNLSSADLQKQNIVRLYQNFTRKPIMDVLLDKTMKPRSASIATWGT